MLAFRNSNFCNLLFKISKFQFCISCLSLVFYPLFGYEEYLFFRKTRWCKEQFSLLSLGDNRLFLFWGYKNKFFEGAHVWHSFSHIFIVFFIEVLWLKTPFYIENQWIFTWDHEEKLILHKKIFSTFISFTNQVKSFLSLWLFFVCIEWVTQLCSCTRFLRVGLYFSIGFQGLLHVWLHVHMSLVVTQIL